MAVAIQFPTVLYVSTYEICLNILFTTTIVPHMLRIQPNAETRKKQLDAWRTLLLDFCRTQKISTIDVREGDRLSVFNNTTISSRCQIIYNSPITNKIIMYQKSHNFSVSLE